MQAADYSLTRSWVLGLDVVYQGNASTRLTGTILAPGSSAGAPPEHQSGRG
jgi:hypothetical protein